VSYGVIKLGIKVANLAKCWPPAIKKSLHITIKRFNTRTNGSPSKRRGRSNSYVYYCC